MSVRAIAEFRSHFGFSPAEAAGLARCRHNRETGTLVSVYDATEAGIDTWGWATVCEEHASCVIHPSRALAESHAAEPSGWCEPCRTMVYSRKREDPS